MKLSKIKPNPNNPRIIKDSDFYNLVLSIKEFPKMMSLRPMVIDRDNFVLGGNMRLKALKEIGYKDIPDEWVKYADDLTDDEKQRFIIADNSNAGLWDWDKLKEWDDSLLIEYGLENGVETFFEPNLSPDQGSKDITDNEISKKANEMASQMLKEGKYQDVICPECGHEFKIS